MNFGEDNSGAPTLRVTLSENEHSSAAVAWLFESLDSLPSASVWATLMYSADSSPEQERAACAVRNGMMEGFAIEPHLSMFDSSLRSFVYEFRRKIDQLTRETGSDRTLEIVTHATNINPFDPIELSLQAARNSYLRRIVLAENQDLFHKVFGFAEISKAEHNSPLLVELTIIGAAATISTALTYGLMRAAAHFRKHQEEIRIRQAEANIREEEAKQWKIKTELLEIMRDTIREKRMRGEEIQVPEQALVAAANLASPAIQELSSSALVKNVTFGVTVKGGIGRITSASSGRLTPHAEAPQR